MKISTSELVRIKQLVALGIPVDGEIVEKSEAACQGLRMAQDPNIPQTNLFDLRSGGTGVLITLTIWNDSDQIIRLDTVRLRIPWCEQVRWLKDPSRMAPREEFYSFPAPDVEKFDRDSVLNHRFGRKGQLFPGDCLNGYLLGVGEEFIPARFKDRQSLRTHLLVFDARRNRYPLDVEFLVRRELKRHETRTAAEVELVRAARKGEA